MHRISTILAALLLAAFAACDFDESDEAVGEITGDAETSDSTAAQASSPQQTLDEMRRFDRAGDYEKLLACMTKRARGEYLRSAYTLLHGSARYMVDPKKADQFQQILKRFQFEESDALSDLLWGSSQQLTDDQGEAIVDWFGDRVADFLGECRKEGFLLARPGLFFATKIHEIRSDGDHRIVRISELSTEANDDQREIAAGLEAEFVGEGNRWLFNCYLEKETHKKLVRDSVEKSTKGREAKETPSSVPTLLARPAEPPLSPKITMKLESPEQTWAEMARCEKDRDYKQFFECMSKRGRGDQIVNMLIILRWGAHAQREPERAKPFNDLFKTYEVGPPLVPMYELDGPRELTDEEYEQFADHFAGKEVAFTQDFYAVLIENNKHQDSGTGLISSLADLQIKKSQGDGQRHVLIVVEAGDDWPLGVEFVRDADRWFLNGFLEDLEPDDEEPADSGTGAEIETEPIEAESVPPPH